MPSYINETNFQHADGQAIGVLLVNLGTPDAPTTGAVRRYLKTFLWDPRVIEQPRWLWWLILNLVILRIRPSRSAAAYRKIWTAKGSPLLLHSQAIADTLGESLAQSTGVNIVSELGMSYGSPSITDALERLRAKNVRRLIVLPLYPQYSATTTASVFEAVTRALSAQRWIPELRFINQYHDRDALISALAESVRAHWASSGRGERLMFSFHGIPQRYFHAGDPYHCQCQKTARLVATALGLERDEWQVSFQSRVGREPWLNPYTDHVLTDWGQQGIGKIDVICPGFAADCLETLEEIAMQNRDLFVDAGGGELRYIASLNESPAHIQALRSLVEEHMGSWPQALREQQNEAAQSAQLANSLMAEEHRA